MNKIVPVLEDESMISYVHRMAKENFYDSVQSLSSSWGIIVMRMNNNFFNAHAFSEMSKFTGIEASKLYERTSNFVIDNYGEDFFKKYVVRNSVKYCPACVENELFLRHKWSYQFVTCCLEHRQLLIDHCQKCGSILKIGSFMTGSCPSCGFIYKYANRMPLEDEINVQSQEIINNLWENNTSKLQYPFNKLSLSEFLFLANKSLHLISGLTTKSGANDVLQSFRTKNQKDSNLKSHLNYLNVVRLYDNYPENFSEVLKNLSKLSVKNQRTKIDAFNQIAAAPRLAINFEQVLKLTEVYNQTLTANSKPIEIGELMIKDGNRKKRIGCGASKNIVLELSNPSPKYCRRSEAALLLGVSEKVQINTIIDAGYLKLKKFPGSQYYLLREDVMRFLRKYRGNFDPNNQGIKFYDALNKFNRTPMRLLDLLELIKLNRITPHLTKFNGSLADVAFDNNELISCVETLKQWRRERRGYTRMEVRQLLKLDYNTLLLLEEKKKLVPDETVIYKSAKRKVNYYRMDRIEGFQNRYIDINQAAQRFHISSRIIRQWIYEGELEDEFVGMTKKYYLDTQKLSELITRKGIG